MSSEIMFKKILRNFTPWTIYLKYLHILNL
jgi:hypothetical protein